MKTEKILGGTLLVAGITIGAGMLALPLTTGLSGFIPSSILFITCWFIMLIAAFLLVELNLYWKTNVNLISMAKHTLGTFGSIFTWIIYSLLLYSLLAAYLANSNALFLEPISLYFHCQIPSSFGPLVPIFIFGPFILLGLKFVDYLNRVLMSGMMISYILMISLIGAKINFNNLYYYNYRYSKISLALIITAFGYHFIIPTLTTYLDRDIKSIKICLVLGSFIPLISYLIWEMTILGIIPVKGYISITSVIYDHISIPNILYKKLQDMSVLFSTHIFSIFAIITSFLGVAQSLFDFLYDGLALKRNNKNNFIVSLFTFCPPLIITIWFKASFIVTLEYAGIFVALLIGILPICMIYIARYKLNMKNTYNVSGGKFTLYFIFLFFFISILVILYTKIEPIFTYIIVNI